MGGSGISSGTVDDPPHIVEQSNGKTYALSSAWVTFNGRKLVLAYCVDEDGVAESDDADNLWCTEELTDSNGTMTYNDTYMMSLPESHDEWIWARLEAIDGGTAESGPLFADGLQRVVVEKDNYALTEAWVTHNDLRFVELQNVYDDGELVNLHDAFSTAIQNGKGETATYTLDPRTPVSRLDAVLLDRIIERLEEIREGAAESGPLDAEETSIEADAAEAEK